MMYFDTDNMHPFWVQVLDILVIHGNIFNLVIAPMVIFFYIMVWLIVLTVIIHKPVLNIGVFLPIYTLSLYHFVLPYLLNNSTLNIKDDIGLYCCFGWVFNSILIGFSLKNINIPSGGGYIFISILDFSFYKLNQYFGYNAAKIDMEALKVNYLDEDEEDY